MVGICSSKKSGSACFLFTLLIFILLREGKEIFPLFFLKKKRVMMKIDNQ